ncbi:MAG: O-antigen ligase family protein [Sphingorhabdus sp.]|uniref:O-antigen ligase family protein n=1 Tax=Sphingorhabdus sp. TaxID=1902408 RepID=UPI0038FC34E5
MTQDASQANPHGQNVMGFAPPLERIERLRQLCLGAACFLLSWHVLRVGDFNFTASDFLFLVCFGLFLVRQSLNMMALNVMTAHWCAALAMMLGGLLIGSVFNGDPLRWANIAGQYIFGFLLLPMVFMSEDRVWIRKCLLYFVLGVAASQIVALSLASFFSFDQSNEMLGPSVVAGNGRLGGLVSDANLNGAVIAFSIIALFNAQHHGLIRNFFAICVGAVLLWALLTTASFTAFASTGIATCIYFVSSNLGRFMKVGIPLMICAVAYIALGLPLPEAFSERVLGAVLTGDLSQAGTFTHRSALIVEAWEMSKDTLFVGLGVDRFRVESIHGMPVHQFWMLLLTEGGIISFTGLVLMFGILGMMGIRAFNIHREDGAMALAILVILLIFSTSIPHMYNRLWITPMMLALAASFARNVQIYFMPETSGEYDDIFEVDGTPTALALRGPQA